MQPNKFLSEMRFFDYGGTMTGIYPAENKSSVQHKKLVRMLTVAAYLLCVSLAAILLSLYYLFLWNPDMNKDLPDIQSGFTKELCSSTQQQIQSQQHAQYMQRLEHQQLEQQHRQQVQQQDEQRQPVIISIVNSDSIVTKVPLTDRQIQIVDSDGNSVHKATDFSSPSSRRGFVPYPAAVLGVQPGLFPLFPDPLNPLSPLTPLGAAGQLGQPLKGPLDLSLNPPAHDVNADLQTLPQAASSDSSSSAVSVHQQELQQQPLQQNSGHLIQISSAQMSGGGDQAVYDNSKRSSSNNQEEPEISSSQEVLTYQDGSALNSSNVSSSEY